MTEQECLAVLLQMRTILAAVVNHCGGSVELPRDPETWSGVVKMLKDPDGPSGPSYLLRTRFRMPEAYAEIKDRGGERAARKRPRQVRQVDEEARQETGTKEGAEPTEEVRGGEV